jgi:hypothetical protein
MSEDPLNNLKRSLDQLLQADTSIKRKHNKRYIQKRDLFINLINHFESCINKSHLLEKDFNIDLSKYEENFFQVIDSLILLSFGKQIYNLISFYFYEKHNPDGTENSLIIEETGEELYIKDVEDLWNLILRVKPDIFDEKG